MVASASRRLRRERARQQAASTTRAAGLHNANVKDATMTDGDEPPAAAATTDGGASSPPTTTKDLTVPILALPTEISQHILTYTILDTDITHDPTNPLELVAQYHKLRLVCWKWNAQMEHVMAAWKRRRRALLDKPWVEKDVERWAQDGCQKADAWLAMRAAWRDGVVGEREVEGLERRAAVKKMQRIRKWRRCRVKRQIEWRRAWERWVAVRMRRGMMRYWKSNMRHTVETAHTRGVELAEGVEPMPASYHSDADDELELEQWAEEDEMDTGHDAEDGEQADTGQQAEGSEHVDTGQPAEDSEEAHPGQLAEEAEVSEQMDIGE